MGSKKLVAMVADDHPWVCDSIALMLTNRFEVYKATNEEAAKKICKAYHLSIAFIDARMAPGSGISLVKFMTEKYLSVKAVGISSFAEEPTIAEFIQAGVVGFIPKATIRQSIIDECVDVILSGGTYFSKMEEAIRQKLLSKHVFPSTQLSKREMEIAKLLSKGLSHKEIGEHLALAKTTIDDYAKNLLTKTSTKSSTELMAFLHRNGVL